MITILEGSRYMVKIVESNRHPRITVYELCREYGQEFPSYEHEEAKKDFMELSPRQYTSQEVDQIVEKHFLGKKGNRCL